MSATRVYRRKGDGAYRALPAEGLGASFDDSDVVPGHQYSYQVTAVSDAGEESERSAPTTVVPAGVATAVDRGTFAYLWSSNTRREPTADWCWDDDGVPSFCGIAEEPVTVSDTSVRILAADGHMSAICDGDCTSPSNEPFELFAPEVSPEGTRVAYIEINDDDQALLRVANTDGSNDRTLCDPAGGSAPCLDAWPDTSPLVRHCRSPDECFSIRGTTAGALTASLTSDREHILYGGNGLYRVGLTGAPPTKLTAVPEGQRVLNARETPDGSRIYFDIVNATRFARGTSAPTGATCAAPEFPVTRWPPTHARSRPRPTAGCSRSSTPAALCS
jgi:hypothetical protein